MEEEEQDQMEGAGQMDDDEEEEEDGGSPDGGNVGGAQGMTSDDYEEIDYKICGELGKLELLNLNVEEKNRALNEFA